MTLGSKQQGKMHIALVGTRGVPARYGGFETCVEEVGQRLVARGHDVTVYCRRSGAAPMSGYKGMTLIHLPALKRRSLETLSHTGLSSAHLFVKRADAAIVFNAANSPWLSVIRAAGIPVATHVDGLEWKRAKWGPLGKRYYRVAESLAVRWSDVLIADAPGIQDYYRNEFGVDSTYLAYGAPILQDAGSERLREVNVEPREYHLVVARFEPENHVHLIVEGFTRSAAGRPLVVVGSAPYADAYTAALRELGDERVRFVGGVWDQQLLDQLYANALVYWHGHSVGGTNPSLLRAMGAGAPVNAFDVNFNRQVLGEAGEYFDSSDDVSRLAEDAEERLLDTRLRGKQAQAAALSFDWEHVADGYERLCRELASRRLQGAGHARRTGAFPLRRSPSGAEGVQ